MAIHSQLPDVPWHVGYVKKKDWDPRRHKSRCKYYDPNNKKCITAKSPCVGQRCGGSAHCDVYEEKKSSVEEQMLVDSVSRKKPHVAINSSNRGKTDVVAMDDIVSLQNVDTGVIVKHKMMTDLKGKLTDMTKRCLNRKVGSVISVNGQNYKILDKSSRILSSRGTDLQNSKTKKHTTVQMGDTVSLKYMDTGQVVKWKMMRTSKGVVTEMTNFLLNKEVGSIVIRKGRKIKILDSYDSV